MLCYLLCYVVLGVRAPQFLSLLVKAMRTDVSVKRVAAFAKRLLQVGKVQVVVVVVVGYCNSGWRSSVPEPCRHVMTLFVTSLHMYKAGFNRARWLCYAMPASNDKTTLTPSCQGQCKHFPIFLFPYLDSQRWRQISY
jgi:hypothetical protein